MATSWSVALNVLLLIVVVIAIGRMLKIKREQTKPRSSGSVAQPNSVQFDDIIAVRKVDAPHVRSNDAPVLTPHARPVITPVVSEQVQTPPPQTSHMQETVSENSDVTLMIFLLAKDNRNLAGYELLQTILTAGLRFGEGDIFHRHQFPHGQGPILCSLAVATEDGRFDLQNIGAFSARGLCLFMQASGNVVIDEERLDVMYETARQLSEGLDAHLLDDHKQPFTNMSLERYMQVLGVSHQEALA